MSMGGAWLVRTNGLLTWWLFRGWEPSGGMGPGRGLCARVRACEGVGGPSVQRGGGRAQRAFQGRSRGWHQDHFRIGVVPGAILTLFLKEDDLEKRAPDLRFWLFQ